MADHPNVDRLRRGYAAFAGGDLDTLRNEIFAEDVVFHVTGNNPLAGDYKGIDEVFGFFGRLVQETGGTLKIELHDALANDEHAVGLVRISGERNGKSLAQNVVHVYHANPDGKVTEQWSFPENSAAVDEFWS